MSVAVAEWLIAQELTELTGDPVQLCPYHYFLPDLMYFLSLRTDLSHCVSLIPPFLKTDPNVFFSRPAISPH